MAVDRMAPFRFVLLQIILMTSVLAYGAISHLKQGITVRFALRSVIYIHNSLGLGLGLGSGFLSCFHTELSIGWIVVDILNSILRT